MDFAFLRNKKAGLLSPVTSVVYSESGRRVYPQILEQKLAFDPKQIGIQQVGLTGIF